MLSVRLFIFISSFTIVCFVLYTYKMITTHTQNLMETVNISANRASDIIKKSTRYSMLLNRKEDVDHIINTIASEPGVNEIRIYNKKGEIIFSTIPKEIHNSVDLKAEACNICHSEQKPLESLPMENRQRIYRDAKGHRVVGLINPIDNELECVNAACHSHDSEQTILGVLDVKMSLATVDMQLKQSQREMVVFAVFMVLGIALFSGYFIYFVVRKRIKALITGTKEIAAGNLDYQMDIKSQDELGQLALSFNKMSRDLKKAHEEISEWSNSLEKKVAQKTEELKKAQEHMVRIENLASLGKLSATVAHEINNPLAGILNYNMLALRSLKSNKLTDQKKADIIENLTLNKSEIIRIGDIVKNMLIFAKQTGGEFHDEHLHNLIESSIKLVKHQMQLKEIQLEKHLECQNDIILCDPGQIRQALIALFVNASEAMCEQGILSIATKEIPENDSILMTIQDTGTGIPEDILPHIFDPFFSTKNKGTGLGLSVSYGIVKNHEGDIQVFSNPGEGTRFILEFPILIQAPEPKTTLS